MLAPSIGGLSGFLGQAVSWRPLGAVAPEEITDALLSSDPARMASRAFLVAILVTLIGPILVTSWSGTWTSLLGWSSARVGGVTLALGALAGATVSTWLRQPMGVVIGVAAGLGLVSLLAEREVLNRRMLHRVVPLLGALVVVRAGLRADLTLVGPLDAALTVAWVAALPASLAGLDRRGRSGLRLTGCGAISVALLVLALTTGEGEVAAATAATAGALLSLVGGGRSPAAVVDGTAEVVMGFLLAVSTVQVAGALDGLTGLAVAVVLWAVPVTNALISSLARARRGLGWAGGTGGHLLRRLGTRGIGLRPAAMLLGGIHLAGAGAAVAAGRGWLTVGPALALGLGPLLVLVAFTYSAAVHRAEVTGLPRPVRAAVAAVVLGLPMLAAPAAWALIGAQGRLEEAGRLAESALSRIRDGDTVALDQPGADDQPVPEGISSSTSEPDKPDKPDKASKTQDENEQVAPGGAGEVPPEEAPGRPVSGEQSQRAKDACGAPRDPVTCLSEAAAVFGEVADQLSGPLASLGRVVPVVSPNLVAARTLVAAGRDLATAGSQLATNADPDTLSFRDGVLPLDEVRALSSQLDEAAVTFKAAERSVLDVDGRYLFAPVRRRVDELATRLVDTSDDVETIAQAVRLAPAVLGGSGTRRYFLAVQNNAEARATGGLIGNFGVLEATNGRLTVQRFGRLKDLRDSGLPLEQRMLHLPPDSEYLRRYGEFQPESTWQNVNLSPDFPTVGRVVADLYPQSGGQPIDGVIAIDSLGLAALMELTGPVNVGEWPEKITSENVVRVTLSDAYERFATKAERVDFLADVADTVVAKLARGGLPSPVRMAKVLGDAARQRHISMFLVPAAEQRLLARLGIDGAVDGPVGDSLLITNQNAGANKVDYYLRRRIRYEVDLRPGNGVAEAEAKLDVTFENGAPASGLDQYVIGPNAKDVAAGENVSITSVFGALRLRQATLDGRPFAPGVGTELGHNVYRDFLRIPAASSRTLHMELAGTVALEPGGWYRLDLLHQPRLTADAVEIRVTLPDGWQAADVEGMEVEGMEVAGLPSQGQARNNPPAGGRRVVVGTVDLAGDQTVRIRLERT